MQDEGGRRRHAKVPYRVYTRRHDVVTDWSGLQNVLEGKTSSASVLEHTWRVLDSDLLPWRTALLITASKAAGRIRAQLPDERLNDAAVTLLLDQSGSMRGQKMLYAAASLDVVQEFLAGLGIAAEVLGFTTVSWRGGRAYRRWRLFGFGRAPGRLNGLLHIVYRRASDTRVSASPHAFREMLRPELPKENIDGEALEWAVERLRAQNRPRRILLVISDGAPVDDATLAANNAHYLEDHLLDVIAHLDQAGDVELHAMGLGFDVGRYYPAARSVVEPAALGKALVDQLERLLTAGPPPR